jgi:hypothetical protein
MLFAKELDGLIYLTNFDGASAVDWQPVVVGNKPNLTYHNDQYILTFEFLSHTYVTGIDPNVWPPLFLNPIENHGAFWQITQAADSISIGSHTQASTNCFFPALNEQIFLKYPGYLFYDVNTATYSTTISLDFSKFSQPTGWRAYRIYKRVNGGVWTLFQDWASDFQNIPVSQTGAWNTEFCAVWGWNWDPRYSSRDVYVQSPISNAPVLTIPSSPITLTVSVSDSLTLRNSQFSAVIPLPPMHYYTLVVSDIIKMSNNNSESSYLANPQMKFLVLNPALPTDPNDQLKISTHTSSSVVGGLR